MFVRLILNKATMVSRERKKYSVSFIVMYSPCIHAVAECLNMRRIQNQAYR